MATGKSSSAGASHRRRLRRRVIAVAICLLASVATGWLVASQWRQTAGRPQPANRPVQFPSKGYVTSRVCQECHEQQHETWHASYHSKMTRLASPDTILGDFDNVELTHYDRSYHLSRRGDEFWVDLPDPGGQDTHSRRISRQIVLVTGSHHRQGYWYPRGDHRPLGLFPWVYLIAEQQWIPRHTAALRPPSKHAPSETGRWNRTCIKCHATHGRQRPLGDDRVDTQVSEFGISCEACHGPGREHVRIHQGGKRPGAWFTSAAKDGDVVQPANLPAPLSAQVCGQCHSVMGLDNEKDIKHWQQHGFRYRPGDELTATRFVVRPRVQRNSPTLHAILRGNPGFLARSFWSDGMIRVSGREYNGLIESPCYRGGEFSCLSCHTLHKADDDPRPVTEWANDQLAFGMDTNQACLQCHASLESDIQRHTFHAPQSTGSQCYNCHMPHTSYGLFQAIRSHQIDSPTVSASLKTGRPNACNLCHLDKTLAWTAEHLNAWYETPKPSLTEDERNVAASVLWALKGDAGQRVLVAWSMGWQPAHEASGRDWLAPYLANLLTDPYDPVRFFAHRSLRGLPGYGALDYDFLAPPDQRLMAAEQVNRRWTEGRHGVARRTALPLLIGPDGEIQLGEFNRLLSRRDNRPMNVAE